METGPDTTREIAIWKTFRVSFCPIQYKAWSTPSLLFFFRIDYRVSKIEFFFYFFISYKFIYFPYVISDKQLMISKLDN